jgi:hypothetical protein
MAAVLGCAGLLLRAVRHEALVRSLRIFRLFDEPAWLIWIELARWPLVVNVVGGTTTPALWPAGCAR